MKRPFEKRKHCLPFFLFLALPPLVLQILQCSLTPSRLITRGGKSLHTSRFARISTLFPKLSYQKVLLKLNFNLCCVTSTSSYWIFYFPFFFFGLLCKSSYLTKIQLVNVPLNYSPSNITIKTKMATFIITLLPFFIHGLVRLYPLKQVSKKIFLDIFNL